MEISYFPEIVSRASPSTPDVDHDRLTITPLTSIGSKLRPRLEHCDSGYASAAEDSRQNSDLDLQDILKRQSIVGTASLTDEEIVELAQHGHIQAHSLEKVLGDNQRAVAIRRSIIEREESASLAQLPWQDYDYDQIIGRCAENVLGYMPIPVGYAGPLSIDGRSTPIPMSTTEGTLIASTSRGCKALNAAGGVNTELLGDAMTRAPCIRFPDIRRTAYAKRLLDSDEMQAEMRRVFSTTTRFGNLLDVVPRMAGCYLYLRFRAKSGEAMGMNMLGKGTDAVLQFLKADVIPDMDLISISGNMCSDKKPAAINWIEGRGKSVVAEAIIPSEVVTRTLKTTTDRIVNLNISKNLIGSALAGMSAGGYNAHAANIVAAIYLATGQDPAQVVTSSNCMTMMERTSDGSLHATVTMPSIEVGTIGGGTQLSAQASMLELMGCSDPSPEAGNAGRLARIVAAAVLAGELSLCSALASGDLIKSHMKFNRRPC